MRQFPTTQRPKTKGNSQLHNAQKTKRNSQVLGVGPWELVGSWAHVELGVDSEGSGAEGAAYRGVPGNMPRVRESVIVMPNRMISQKTPDAPTSHVSRELQRTCMKNRMTSSAFAQAIDSIRMLLSTPRSKNATSTVRPVPTISAANTK